MSAKRVRISSPPSGDQLERSNSTAHPHTAYWESATSMKKLTAESVVSSDKRQRKLTSATAIGQSLPLNHTSPPQSRVAQMSPDPEGDCMPCARRICWRVDYSGGLSVSFLIARYRSWPRERCHEDVPLWFRVAPPFSLDTSAAHCLHCLHCLHCWNWRAVRSRQQLMQRQPVKSWKGWGEGLTALHCHREGQYRIAGRSSAGSVDKREQEKWAMARRDKVK